MYKRPDFIEITELTETQRRLVSALDRMGENFSHFGENAVAKAIQDMIDEAVRAALEGEDAND